MIEKEDDARGTVAFKRKTVDADTDVVVNINAMVVRTQQDQKQIRGNRPNNLMCRRTFEKDFYSSQEKSIQKLNYQKYSLQQFGGQMNETEAG